MEDSNMKEVRFDLYCKTCKSKPVDMAKQPCFECLGEPARKDTCKPLMYEENKSARAKVEE